MVGDEVETKIRWFLSTIRQADGIVNYHIAIATARGVIKSKNANLLLENGGHMDINKDWVKRLLVRMNLVKRHMRTKAKLCPTNFENLKKQYLADIRSIVFMEKIPMDLIINWDHTGIKYAPISNWTLERKGVKHVEIAGEDKRQLTAVLTCTMSGKLLPTQVIYGGITPACLPKVSPPAHWNLTFTKNHWSNEELMMMYFHIILLPYVQKHGQT